MTQLKTVEYLDQKGKSRWGYICTSSWTQLKKFLRQKDGSKGRVTVYLPDGTTGDVALSDLKLIEPFMEASPLPEVPAEAKDELLLENEAIEIQGQVINEELKGEPDEPHTSP